MTMKVDLIIAGAGLAGSLLANRLRKRKPDLSIALIEKEAMAGGRLRSSIPETGIWSYGLNFLTPDLFDYLKSDLDLEGHKVFRHQKIGLLSASKVSDLDLQTFFTKKGAKALGGLAAMRDWEHVEDIAEALASGKRKDQAFHSIWSGTKKSGAALVLEQMVQPLGIPDLWSASAAHLFAKAKDLISGRYIAEWEVIVAQMVENLIEAGNDKISISLNSQIIGAAFDEVSAEWTLSTRTGQFTAPQLIVAQSPWDAVEWLPKKHWPATLLQFAVKAKPVSAVVLSEVLEDAQIAEINDIANLILIPAEEAHAIVSPSGEVCYQTTIDYEVSLQAPDVVKAVKRLKRARKKLLQAYPQLAGKGEHLALMPVAWTQPPAMTDRRLADKTEDRYINTQSLMFCGDSYGRSFIGDHNLIRSVESVFARITGEQIQIDLGDEPIAEEADQNTDERTDY